MMANGGLLPLSVKTSLQYFNQIIVKNNGRLLTKLYKQEYNKLIKENKNNPNFIPPGLYPEKALKHIKTKIRRNKKKRAR